MSVLLSARGLLWRWPVVSVETRGTHGDLLHRVAQRGMVELRHALEAADRSLPGFVWRELERYLACGDPERGFAWLVCDCDFHRLVPFSCKGRAFCPACGVDGWRSEQRAGATRSSPSSRIASGC